MVLQVDILPRARELGVPIHQRQGSGEIVCGREHSPVIVGEQDGSEDAGDNDECEVLEHPSVLLHYSLDELPDGSERYGFEEEHQGQELYLEAAEQAHHNGDEFDDKVVTGYFLYEGEEPLLLELAESPEEVEYLGDVHYEFEDKDNEDRPHESWGVHVLICALQDDEDGE